MKYIIKLPFALLLFTALLSCQPDAPNSTINFSNNWKFILLNEGMNDNGFETLGADDGTWEDVSLPHTAKLEKYLCNDMWQGTCWYRKSFDVPASYKNKKLILEFEGAMGTSQYWINGKEVSVHEGGFLPVVMDISEYVIAGQKNVVAVKLDNRDNVNTGPKPLKKLDFCFYGGLYRNAHLIVKEKIHISHPAIANKVAGGGIFVHTPKVSENESIVVVETHVVNEGTTGKSVQIVQNVLKDGKLIESATSTPIDLESTKDNEFTQQIKMNGAQLWSPKHPILYTLQTVLLVDGIETERETTRFGIREIKFIENQLYINGEKTFLRGTNRHQEYPYLGYALSDKAQYRDAFKIKASGFDYVRLSHYPQSPAFMDACDELGLLVLDAIMGWQYYLEEDRFKNYCYKAAQQLIRRDRNHASVLAWEVSLNETHMPEPFMQQLHDIVHQEYPYSGAYSAGWKPEVYDIYLEARQHRIMHPNEHPDKPFMVSEYGDWEYYSRNAGLNQHNLDKKVRVEKSSRQLRSHGEARLLQQCYNLQESHNDNRANTTAFSDGFWVMYDYNSGVHNEHCCSGVMDMNRIRKFSSWFYQSQRDLDEDTVLHIASYWTKESPLDVKVYSNCEEVELLLNGKSIAKQKPDSDKNSSHLEHPPFSFKLKKFEAGKLESRGFVNGKIIAHQTIQTPLKPTKLKVWVDESGKALEAGVKDVVFVYVAAVDKNGTIVPNFFDKIDFKIEGDAKLLNTEEIIAEAGIATSLIQIGAEKKDLKFSASSKQLRGELKLRLQ